MRNVILTGLLFAMAFPSAAASKDHDTSVDPPPCSPKMRQVVLNQVLQRFAHHPFHGVERAPALFGNLIDGADVGVVQRGSGTCLWSETLQRNTVMHKMIGKNLLEHRGFASLRKTADMD